MAKPQPSEIPSDDFECPIGGELYRLHEGETVTVLPASTVADNKLAHALLLAQSAIEAAGEDDPPIEIVSRLDEVNDAICAKLAERILAWTWTDDAGRPRPQPNGDPAAFHALRQQEVMYLWRLARGQETAAESKNA